MPERACIRVRAPAPDPRVGRLGVALTLLVATVVAQLETMAARAAAPSEPFAAWLEVREQTTCEAMQDDYCLGRYGFTIEHSGIFIAGPSGGGSKVQGQIELSKLRRLRELIGQVSSSLPNSKRICSRGGLPGIKDQVDITFSGGSVVRVYDLGGRVGTLCYVGKWSQVRAFHDYLHGLMAFYYPVPFLKN